jgi:hypothetical protein
MKVTITIKTNNAAFVDNPGGEVARILRRLAESYEFHGRNDVSIDLRDVNGNRVGQVKCE